MKIINSDGPIYVVDDFSNIINVIKKITNRGVQEEAFHIFDIGDIVRKYQIWTEKLPRVEPYYAVKCNDNITVLKVLAALGAGFDCASKAEINTVLNMGIDPSKIIFANPTKPASHVSYASSVGVAVMTVDNEYELYKIKGLYPTAKIVIRFRCDAKIASSNLGIKFGCDPESEAPNLLSLSLSLNLDVIGFSFHVGSGCQDPPAYLRAIRLARGLFDSAIEMGFKPYLLDIGGGYPGDMKSSFDKMADNINQGIDECFNTLNVKIIAEPGRYFVESAFTLASSIHSKRSVRDDKTRPNVTTHNMYYIHDGVYGSLNCLFYDHKVVTPIPLKIGSGKMIPSSIWGPTGDGLDLVCEHILLHEMQIDDWFIIENMGAYTLPMASNFNGFPVPKLYIVAENHIWRDLKDNLPITEEHFVMGDFPDNIN